MKSAPTYFDFPAEQHANLIITKFVTRKTTQDTQ